MITGVTGFCQFCHTPYNTCYLIIYLFFLMTVYIRICFYSLYDKTDKMTKTDGPLKINGSECHKEIIAVMTQMTKVGERGFAA